MRSNAVKMITADAMARTLEAALSEDTRAPIPSSSGFTTAFVAICIGFGALPPPPTPINSVK